MEHLNRHSKTKRHSITFPKQGRTKQSMSAECDVNNIMKTFKRTGQLPDMIKNNPQYGDYSEVQDYREALDTIKLAEHQFAALNAHVRGRFNNNPEEFLGFCKDPKNLEEMQQMGLAQKPNAPAPKSAEKAPKEPKKETKKEDK